MARSIITESQANRDNLLQILLYKMYRAEFEIMDGGLFMHPEGLSFDAWLEKILREF